MQAALRLSSCTLSMDAGLCPGPFPPGLCHHYLEALALQTDILPLKPKGDKFYKVSPSHSCFGNALHPKSSEIKSLLSPSYPALVLKL